MNEKDQQIYKKRLIIQKEKALELLQIILDCHVYVDPLIISAFHAVVISDEHDIIKLEKIRGFNKILKSIIYQVVKFEKKNRLKKIDVDFMLIAQNDWMKLEKKKKG